jgi:hypothetical protein
VHYLTQLDVEYTTRYWREGANGIYEELKQFEHKHYDGITNEIATAHVEKNGESYQGEKGIVLKGYVINDEERSRVFRL